MNAIEPFLSEDVISRSIIEPTHLDRLGHVLKLAIFTFNDNQVSVNCHRFFQTDMDVHQLGKKLANFQNRRREKEGKLPDKIYRGYIESTIEKIHNIQVEDMYFKVEHHPRDDNYAHCHIHLKIPDNSKPTKAIKIMIEQKLLETFSSLNSCNN